MNDLIFDVKNLISILTIYKEEVMIYTALVIIAAILVKLTVKE